MTTDHGSATHEGGTDPNLTAPHGSAGHDLFVFGDVTNQAGTATHPTNWVDAVEVQIDPSAHSTAGGWTNQVMTDQSHSQGSSNPLDTHSHGGAADAGHGGESGAAHPGGHDKLEW